MRPAGDRDRLAHDDLRPYLKGQRKHGRAVSRVDIGQRGLGETEVEEGAWLKMAVRYQED